MASGSVHDTDTPAEDDVSPEEESTLDEGAGSVHGTDTPSVEVPTDVGRLEERVTKLESHVGQLERSIDGISQASRSPATPNHTTPHDHPPFGRSPSIPVTPLDASPASDPLHSVEPASFAAEHLQIDDPPATQERTPEGSTFVTSESVRVGLTYTQSTASPIMSVRSTGSVQAPRRRPPPPPPPVPGVEPTSPDALLSLSGTVATVPAGADTDYMSFSHAPSVPQSEGTERGSVYRMDAGMEQATRHSESPLRSEADSELVESWRTTERCQKALNQHRSDYNVLKADLQSARAELQLTKKALHTQTELTKTREAAIELLQAQLKELGRRSPAVTYNAPPTQDAVLSALRRDLTSERQLVGDLRSTLAKKEEQHASVVARAEELQRALRQMQVEAAMAAHGSAKREAPSPRSPCEGCRAQKVALESLEQDRATWAATSDTLRRQLREATSRAERAELHAEGTQQGGALERERAHWTATADSLRQQVLDATNRAEEAESHSIRLVERDAGRARQLECRIDDLTSHASDAESRLREAEARAAQAEQAYARDTNELRQRLEKHREAEADHSGANARLLNMAQVLMEKVADYEGRVGSFESLLLQREDREVETLARMRTEHAEEAAQLRANAARLEASLAEEVGRAQARPPAGDAATMTYETCDGYSSLEKSLQHKQLCLDECVKENNTLIVRIRAVQDDLDTWRQRYGDLEAESGDRQIVLQMEKNELQNRVLFLEERARGTKDLCSVSQTTPASTELVPFRPPDVPDDALSQRSLQATTPPPPASEPADAVFYRQRVSHLEERLAEMERANLFASQNIKESVNRALHGAASAGQGGGSGGVDIAGLYDTICLLDKRNKVLEERLDASEKQGETVATQLRTAESKAGLLAEDNRHLGDTLLRLEKDAVQRERDHQRESRDLRAQQQQQRSHPIPQPAPAPPSPQASPVRAPIDTSVLVTSPDNAAAAAARHAVSLPDGGGGEQGPASPINFFVRKLHIGAEGSLSDPRVRQKILALAEQIRTQAPAGGGGGDSPASPRLSLPESLAAELRVSASDSDPRETIQKESSAVTPGSDAASDTSLKKRLEEVSREKSHRDAMLKKLKTLAVGKIGSLEGEVKRMRKQMLEQEAQVDLSRASAERYKATCHQLQSELRASSGRLHHQHTQSSMPSGRASSSTLYR